MTLPLHPRKHKSFKQKARRIRKNHTLISWRWQIGQTRQTMNLQSCLDHIQRANKRCCYNPCTNPKNKKINQPVQFQKQNPNQSTWSPAEAPAQALQTRSRVLGPWEFPVIAKISTNFYQQIINSLAIYKGVKTEFTHAKRKKKIKDSWNQSLSIYEEPFGMRMRRLDRQLCCVDTGTDTSMGHGKYVNCSSQGHRHIYI